MKSFLSFVAVCALACTLTGCASSSKTTASPGAVGEKKTEGCCGACTDSASKEKVNTSMGAVGEKKEGGCCSDAAKTGASLGAVSEKGSCTGVCPVTGKSGA